MQQRIALDPKLGLSAAEIAAAWNSSQAENGEATVDSAPPGTFLSPEMTIVLVTAAVSIPTTVVATFISEYLKEKFIDKDPPKVTVTTISAPEGQPVWIVTQEEKR